jgi:hypothetical protein
MVEHRAALARWGGLLHGRAMRRAYGEAHCYKSGQHRRGNCKPQPELTRGCRRLRLHGPLHARDQMLRRVLLGNGFRRGENRPEVRHLGGASGTRLQMALHGRVRRAKTAAFRVLRKSLSQFLTFS